MTICMNNPGNKKYKCKIVLDSMDFHETSHLNEFRQAAPGICAKAKGRYALRFLDVD